MFDCVDKHITMKENIEYDYTPVNASIQIIEINETGVYSGKGYEESENGQCPINCGECNDLKQCYERKNTIQYYIGVRENDRNPINYSAVATVEYYYNTNDSGKKYFYKYIDNCKICIEANKCYQGDPEYNLNKSDLYVERIEGYGFYDNTSAYFDLPTNRNGKGYNICKDCNEANNYYCFGNNKASCIRITDDINTYFANDFGRREK